LFDGRPANPDRFPCCIYRGCTAPATYGVERTYLGTMVYCREHMEGIARSKSAARTLRRILSLAEPPTSRLPSPGGTATGSGLSTLRRPAGLVTAAPSSGMLSSPLFIVSKPIVFLTQRATGRLVGWHIN
jgi:hypothetical protein